MELDQRLERELVSLVALTRLRRCLLIRSSSNWTLTVWFYFPAVIALLLLFLAGSNTAWAQATATRKLAALNIQMRSCPVFRSENSKTSSPRLPVWARRRFWRKRSIQGEYEVRHRPARSDSKRFLPNRVRFSTQRVAN